MVFLHYLENCLSQSFHISHANWSLLILCSLGQGLRSQCQVCKMWFPLIFLRTIFHRAFICTMLREGTAAIDFGFTGSKVNVTMVNFVTSNVNMVSAPYLQTCLTQELWYFTCWLVLVRTWHLLIEFTRSNGKVTTVTFVKKM